MASTRPGHIERLPSGSYRVIVYAGTDPLTGRRLRFRQTVKTEEQAQILLGKLLEQVAEGRQPDTGVTVAELLRQYLAVAELDRSTRQTYEGYIRRTIVPALGSMELRKVRGPVLDMIYARPPRESWNASRRPAGNPAIGLPVTRPGSPSRAGRSRQGRPALAARPGRPGQGGAARLTRRGGHSQRAPICRRRSSHSQSSGPVPDSAGPGPPGSASLSASGAE